MREPAANEAFPEAGSSVHVDELPSRTVLHLTSFDPEVFRGGQPRRFGSHELPGRVGLVRPGSPRILCLAPAEWWLVSSKSSNDENLAPALAALVGETWVLTDVSAGFSVLEVSGPEVRRVLNQGCSLDLDPQVFGPGSCARTRFAQIPVVIDLVKFPDRFELYVARSLSAYLKNWLEDAVGMKRG
jgi:heterotetrameric sarcosine oxidase gamma subunit